MRPQFQIANPAIKQELSSTQHRVLRNTYLLLAVSLIPTVIGAFVGININFSFMYASPIMGSLIFIAIFYGMVFMIEKNRNSGVGVALMMVFTFMMGVTLGPILQFAAVRNAGDLVAYAGAGTAIAFFGLAAVSSSTKRDLSFLSKFLVIGFFVLMAAILANIFLQIPALSLTISSCIILFSCAGIAYTINQTVRGGETNYISATLSLYIHLYNLFTSLLHLLLAFSGNRD